MATDYATLLKNYGWGNLTAGLDANPVWSHGEVMGNSFNVPGVGSVFRDPNGNVMFVDPESLAAYQQTGNAPVYDYIWNGDPNGPTKYQASHGGLSADTLGALTAAAITAGIGTGYIPGLDAASAGAETGAMDMGIGGSGILPDGYGGTAALSSGGGALGTAAGGGGDIVPTAVTYSTPSAAELSAAGFDPAGMGITGPGGIGSAGSVAASGAGAANYGAGMSIVDDLLGSVPQGLKDAITSKAGSAIIGGLLGGINGTKQTGTQTVTTQQQIDPRMASILYGPNGNDGFLSKITGLLGTPQDSSLAQFGNQSNTWLGQNGLPVLQGVQGAANGLMTGGVAAPTMSSAQVGPTGSMQASQVAAPSQNGTDLAPAYANMIYGNPAENPYLTGAIQKGINQSSIAFGNMLTDATRNLTENVLPSIRSGAIVNGAMGSSRQGVAEGKALNDFSTQIGRAISQYGQGNTDSAVSAQAGAFSQGQDRALSAMTGLSGQQYGTAFQNASNQQQANQVNYQGGLEKATTDAQLQQQANEANLQSQLGTNQLNTNRTVAGIDANSGLLGSAYTYGTNQDTYGLNKTGKISGLLTPYTGLGGTSTQSQPIYQNTTANVLGGGLLGANIYSLLNKS